MSGRPAARVDDPTEHGAPLGPGPGCDNVYIGGKKAWRGKKKEEGGDEKEGGGDAAGEGDAGGAADAGAGDAGGAADAAGAAEAGGEGLLSSLDPVFENLEKLKGYFELANNARDAFAKQPPPKDAAEAAKQAEDRQVNLFKFGKSLTEQIKEILKKAFPADPDEHACPLPAHGSGKVEDGSENVFINDLPACRKGDHVKEDGGGEDEIAEGCDSVLIGEKNKVLEFAEKIGGLMDFVNNARDLFKKPPPAADAAAGGPGQAADKKRPLAAPPPDEDPAAAAFRAAAASGEALVDASDPAFRGIE